MLKTEDFAKKCICPHLHSDDKFIRCLVTDCMAWRWHDPAEAPSLDQQARPAGWKRPDPTEPRPPGVSETWTLEDDSGWFWCEDDASYEARRVEHIASWPDRRRGYCGLAGRPEHD